MKKRVSVTTLVIFSGLVSASDVSEMDRARQTRKDILARARTTESKLEYDRLKRKYNLLEAQYPEFKQWNGVFPIRTFKKAVEFDVNRSPSDEQKITDDELRTERNALLQAAAAAQTKKEYEEIKNSFAQLEKEYPKIRQWQGVFPLRKFK